MNEMGKGMEEMGRGYIGREGGMRGRGRRGGRRGGILGRGR